jgi:hypothetical protein
MAPLILASTAVPAIAAGDVKAGRQKALACQTCHGMDGAAKLPEAPNLAGQSEIYLVKSLQDYRSGARKNDMMSIVAAPLGSGHRRSRRLLRRHSDHARRAAKMTRRDPRFCAIAAHCGENAPPS